jgi:putative ABC transport system permease protein
MSRSSPDTRADRLYAALLRCYPAAFRARFGGAMQDSFARDRARASGARAHVRLWAAAVADAAWFGLGERLSPRAADPASLLLQRSPMSFAAFRFDWRDAVRALRATPVVTAVAVLSLALGIGANTALFSLINGLRLKTLPVSAPDELVMLANGSWTNPIWDEIRARQHDAFTGAFAWSNDRVDLSTQGQTEFVDSIWASGEMFQVLGVRPERGRLLGPDDDVRGGRSTVAVISDRLWRSRFNADESAIGRSIALNRVPFTIVGVMPAEFFGPEVGRRADVVVPIGADTVLRGKDSFLDGHWTWWLEIMARRKPGQNLEQAQAALRGIQAQVRDGAMPTTGPAEARAGFLKDPFSLEAAAAGRSTLRDRYTRPLTALLVVVGAVLLIACANIANLLLARAAARRHEICVRLALGASRGRLARQLLLESLMLSGAGALAGLAFAQWAGQLLVQQLATSTRVVSVDLSIDWRIAAFTAGVALLTALLFGVAPAFGLLRVSPNDAIKEQGRSVIGDRRARLRNTLVVAQVALSLVLIVAAGLFVRTFVSLSRQPLGFDPEPLLIATVDMRSSGVPADGRAKLAEDLRAAAATVPGISRVAASLITPISGQGWNTNITTPEAPQLTGRARMSWVNAVSPDWFASYGMRVIRGRDFDSSDRRGGEPVVIVNEKFVATFFGKADPVGQQLAGGGLRDDDAPLRVVGVVSDAVYQNARAGQAATIYVPILQDDHPGPNRSLTAVVAGGSFTPVRRGIVEALARVNPLVSVSFREYREQVRASTAQERLVAMLSGFFGVLAVVLSALGLYGVTTYSVNLRRTEIGVRMALGANGTGVVRMVLGRAGRLIAVGIAIGAGMSWWLSRYVGTLLYGLEARDPATIVAAAVTLLTVGVLAGWLPARRAARIDPAIVLRE